MTASELQTRVFFRSLMEGRENDHLIKEAFRHLAEGMQTLDEKPDLPDWHKVIVLKSCMAAALGILESSELHV